MAEAEDGCRRKGARMGEQWRPRMADVGCVMEFVTQGLDFPEAPGVHGALLV